MSRLIRRRTFIRGAIGSSTLLLVGCTKDGLEPAFGEAFKAGDLASFYAQKLILSGQSMAREYGSADITPIFPVVGTRMPTGLEYRRSMDTAFADWRLSIDGLIERPTSFSLADLKNMPVRTQITAHSCEEGWTAIGGWTGVQLSQIIMQVGLKPDARYVFFFCADGWWGSLHLFDALHPQTILAYGMNGSSLPIEHGAPLRLRVERQLGYKSLKYIKRIHVASSLAEIGDGSGANGVAYGYSWNGGI